MTQPMHATFMMGLGIHGIAVVHEDVNGKAQVRVRHVLAPVPVRHFFGGGMAGLLFGGPDRGGFDG